jgi:uncharacterized protein YcbX
LLEAQHLAPGLTPLYANLDDLAVDVETPGGAVIPIDSPELRMSLGQAEGIGELTLLKSDRAMTDCRPVSLISTQTVTALGAEVGSELDQRRFRANIYIDLDGATGSAEDTYVGKQLKFGAKATLAILERDPRCKMITIDPINAHANPEILQTVAKAHEGRVGVYAAVLVEGTIRPGDQITLLN